MGAPLRMNSAWRSFPFTMDMHPFSKDQLDHLHMLLLTKDALIATDEEFERNLPARDGASFRAHRNAERDTRNQLLQAMQGIISLIRYLAKEEKKVISSNCTASQGFISVSTITAYLNGETNWSTLHAKWWESMQSIQLKGKGTGPSPMLLQAPYYACLTTKHNISMDFTRPDLKNNPLVQGTLSTRLVSMFLLHFAGDICSLAFRPGTTELYAIPVGTGAHCCCMEAGKAPAWVPWAIEESAPIHPIELAHFGVQKHLFPLRRFHDADTRHPFYTMETMSCSPNS